MNFNYYWNVIKDRRWIVITAFVVTVVVTLIISLLWPPKYEATATLVLDYDSSNPMNIGMYAMGSGILQSIEYMNTQIEIIKSRKVAVGVVELLKLDKIPEIVEKFEEAKKINPLFFWKKEQNLDIKVWLADSFLSKYLRVEPARDARFLFIKFYSPDPDFSAATANAFAKVYTEYNLELKLIPLRDAGKWFSDKLTDVKDKADKASEHLREYQKKKGLVSQEGRYYDDAVQRLDQINSQMIVAKGKLYEAKVAIKRIEDSKGNYESLPDVISNNLVSNLKIEKMKIEKSLSDLSAKVGTKHPQYGRMQSELQTINAKLNAEIQNIINAIRQEYAAADGRVQSLEKALNAQKGEALNLNTSRYQMDSLNRESEAFKQTYDSVLKKFNETVLQSDMNRTNVFLIDVAVPPSQKYSPKIMLNFLLSLFVGAFLGVGLAFFFEYMDDTIKSVEIIERDFNMPVLATVARIEEL